MSDYLIYYPDISIYLNINSNVQNSVMNASEYQPQPFINATERQSYGWPSVIGSSTVTLIIGTALNLSLVIIYRQRRNLQNCIPNLLIVNQCIVDLFNRKMLICILHEPIICTPIISLLKMPYLQIYLCVRNLIRFQPDFLARFLNS